MGYLFTKDEQPTMQNFNEKLHYVYDKGAPKVGDTLTTAQTNLDDTWLLCNGDEVSVHDYGKLSEMFPSLGADWGLTGVWSGGNSHNTVNCITYANGWWVAGGYTNSGSTYYARIAYTTDPKGTWTTKDLWSGGTQHYAVRCITYADGYWVVGGGNSFTTARIAYTTDLEGTWTTKDLWSDSGNIYTPILRCITYADGYWVVGGRYYDGTTQHARIAYTKDLTGDWTTKDLWSGSDTASSYYYINCITYADGYWVVGGQYFISNEWYARIAYTTDLEGTWTTKDLWSDNHARINYITYANSYWAVCGYYYDGTNYCTRIAYAADLAGDWAMKDLWSCTTIYSTETVNCITYGNGYWAVCGYYYDGTTYYARIAYTKDLTGDWTTKDLWSSTSSATVANFVTYAGGYWMAGGYYYNGANHYAEVAYRSIDGFKLPTISQDRTYTYIKAKED